MTDRHSWDGAIGYNSYDFVYDSWIKIDKKTDADTPDMHFAIMTKTFVFDHITDETYIVITPFVTEESDLEAVDDHACADARLMERSLHMSAVIGISDNILGKVMQRSRYLTQAREDLKTPSSGQSSISSTEISSR